MNPENRHSLSAGLRLHGCCWRIYVQKEQLALTSAPKSTSSFAHESAASSHFAVVVPATRIRSGSRASCCHQNAHSSVGRIDVTRARRSRSRIYEASGYLWARAHAKRFDSRQLELLHFRFALINAKIISTCSRRRFNAHCNANKSERPHAAAIRRRLRRTRTFNGCLRSNCAN